MAPEAVAVLILAALYFLALLPIAAASHRYHIDEAFYTDAAIRMLRTGDFLTPYTADGEPRFQKPILTYWAVAASAKLLGVSLLAARIPFIIAGCLVIWITYKTARIMFGAECGLIASAIILSNIELFSASLRSNPDILATCFISLSLYGLTRLLFAPRRRRLDPLFANGGMGLAVATKGLLGLFPLLIILVLGWFRRQIWSRLRPVLEWRSIGAALLIAGAWFIAAHQRHGKKAIAGFFSDQVVDRLGVSFAGVITNLGMYLLAPVVHFMPWSLLVAVVFLADLDSLRILRQRREACLFAFAGYALLILIFSAANITRVRYLLPGYPALACLGAALLTGAAREKAGATLLTAITRGILILGVAAGIIIIGTGAFVGARMAAGGVVWTAFTLLLLAGTRGRPLTFGLLALALFSAMTLWVYDLFIRPTFSNTPAPAMVARLSELGIEGTEVAAVEIPLRVLGQVRILSEGKVWATWYPDAATAAEAKNVRAILLGESSIKGWTGDGFRLEECGYDYRVRPDDILKAITRHERESALASIRRRYLLAVRSGSVRTGS